MEPTNQDKRQLIGNNEREDGRRERASSYFGLGRVRVYSNLAEFSIASCKSCLVILQTGIKFKRDKKKSQGLLGNDKDTLTRKMHHKISLSTSFLPWLPGPQSGYFTSKFAIHNSKLKLI